MAGQSLESFSLHPLRPDIPSLLSYPPLKPVRISISIKLRFPISLLQAPPVPKILTPHPQHLFRPNLNTPTLSRTFKPHLDIKWQAIRLQ